MVLQNIRDVCKDIIKELIISTESEEYFNKFDKAQINRIIDFIKPKRTLQTTILQALQERGYLVENNEVYSFGPRVTNSNNIWVIK